MNREDLVIIAVFLGCALVALRITEAAVAGKEEKDDDDQDPPLPPATV